MCLYREPREMLHMHEVWQIDGRYSNVARSPACGLKMAGIQMLFAPRHAAYKWPGFKFSQAKVLSLLMGPYSFFSGGTL
jgi:hypothetical protein